MGYVGTFQAESSSGVRKLTYPDLGLRVDGVIGYGISKVLQMHADLMCLVQTSELKNHHQREGRNIHRPVSGRPNQRKK